MRLSYIILKNNNVDNDDDDADANRKGEEKDPSLFSPQNATLKVFTGLIKICPLFHWLPEPLNLSFFRVPIVCQLIYGGKGFKTPAPPTRQIGLSHPVQLSHLWPQPEHGYMFLKQFQFSRPFSVSEDHHFPPLFPLSE